MRSSSRCATRSTTPTSRSSWCWSSWSSPILGGRAAGALAAVTSTLAFDFFLTSPYLSARIDSADDLETALILLAVGLLVGEVAARGRRARRDHEVAAQAVLRVHRVADAVAHGEPLPTVLESVKRELTDLLGLWDCWLELRPFSWVIPRMDRGGTVEGDEHHWLDAGFALPRDGVELPVVERGREVARLVLLGDPDVAVTLEERVVAVALADQFGHRGGDGRSRRPGPARGRDPTGEPSVMRRERSGEKLREGGGGCSAR